MLVRALPEQAEDAPGEITWRGYVVALPDGTQRYFNDLAEIPGIVAELLAAEGPEQDAVSR